MSRVVALVALVSALTACARAEGPVVVPTEELPFPLSRATASEGPTTPTMRATVYFVRRGQLVAARRMLPTDGSRAAPLLRALLEGPTAAEAARGISSRIPAETKLLEVSTRNGVAHVDLSAEFQSPAASDAIILRVAQVVFTLTALPNVDALRFLIDGTPISVATDEGTTVDRPVRATDYASVAPGR